MDKEKEVLQMNRRKDEDPSTSMAVQSMANGLAELLTPVVERTDANIIAVYESQQELSIQLARLTTALQHFSTVSPHPTLPSYVLKLANTRRRLTDVNTKLVELSSRVERMRQQYLHIPIPSDRSTPAALKILDQISLLLPGGAPAPAPIKTEPSSTQPLKKEVKQSTPPLMEDKSNVKDENPKEKEKEPSESMLTEESSSEKAESEKEVNG